MSIWLGIEVSASKHTRLLYGLARGNGGSSDNDLEAVLRLRLETWWRLADSDASEQRNGSGESREAHCG